MRPSFVPFATLALALSLPLAARGQEKPQDAPKPDAPKPDAPKPDAPKPDAPKPDAPKKDEPKKEDPQPDAPRRGPRGQGGRRGGMFDMVGQLKDQLGLNDEQVKKVEEFQSEMRDKMRELRQAGGDFREGMQQLIKETGDKVRGILTDEQKTKYDEWQKQMEEGRRRFQQGGFQRDPAERKKQLMTDAEKALVLTPEEKTAVMPLIEKVIDARAAARTDGDKRREEFLAWVKKGGTPDEMKSKLEDYRKAHEADQGKVTTAQKALKEVLTLEQEAKLVALGILD